MSTKSQLEKLKERKAQLDARIQMISARDSANERKRETRRKILVGAYYLDAARKQNNMEEIRKFMEQYLTRDADRKLFDLSPKEESD